MTRIGTGMAGMKAQQERNDANFSRKNSDFIPYLRLKDDGEIAIMRIVSEHEPEVAERMGVHSSLVHAAFHNVLVYSMKGNPYRTDRVCTLEENEDGELVGECSSCDGDINRQEKFLLWVYVKQIFHKTQNPNPKEPYTAVQGGYSETVEDYRLWMDGFYMTQTLNLRINSYGVLTDRDYQLTRSGIKGSQKVTKDLSALKESPMGEKILEGSRNLPDLGLIADGVITSMDGSGPDTPREGDTGQHQEVDLPSFGGGTAASKGDGFDASPFPSEVITDDVDDLPF